MNTFWFWVIRKESKPQTSHQLSEAVSSLPGPAALFPFGDTFWAQKDYAGRAWTRVVYSTFLLPPPPSLQTSPTWRQQNTQGERNRWRIQNRCDFFELSASHLLLLLLSRYVLFELAPSRYDIVWMWSRELSPLHCSWGKAGIDVYIKESLSSTQKIK